MNYLTYSLKLEDLKNFIKNGWIKTPKDIAQKLKVSERTALRLISRLKESGKDIRYSAKEKSYKIF
jgi:Mn-dependent DtxR family transcriptional regulator